MNLSYVHWFGWVIDERIEGLVRRDVVMYVCRSWHVTEEYTWFIFVSDIT
jgi:hypothetical protein